VVVKRGDTASAAYALDAAAGLLSYYNDYFGAPFPLPKLDLIGGPGSGGFGAMENWGAIFYSERYLLIDAHRSTASRPTDRLHRGRCARDGAPMVRRPRDHGLVGRPVAQRGICFMDAKQGHRPLPSQTGGCGCRPSETKQDAMDVDARDGTHPIITPIDDVLQAASAFDSITYFQRRGGHSHARVLCRRESLPRGVCAATSTHHAYGIRGDRRSVEGDGQGNSAHPITQIAHDFTLQAGVPMVTRVLCQVHERRDPSGPRPDPFCHRRRFDQCS
jgi:hypothetical protein